MGAISCQPLAQGKGVSPAGGWNLKEASGKFPVGGTRTSSGTSCRTSLQHKTKSNKLSRYNSVNGADIWKKGYSSYLGRSHRRTELYG